MFRRHVIAICVLLVVTIVCPSSAHAYQVQYGVVGRCVNDNGTDIISYGTSGNHYIYPKQVPQDGDWVNSVYAGTYSGNFYEAGWFWEPASASPVLFHHLYRVATDRHYEERLVGTVTPGTRATIAIRRSVAVGGDAYEVYVNGAYKDTWLDTDVTSCLPCVGAERLDTLDYNKGSWTYVKHFAKVGTSTYSWTYWPNARSNNDNDPQYAFYWNYVDRSDHYVYVDDNLN